MTTSATRQPLADPLGNEDDGHVTPAEDAIDRKWAAAGGFSAEDISLLFGHPDSQAGSHPGGSAPPSIDLGALDQKLSAGHNPATNAGTAPASMPQGGGLMNEFMESIRRPEAEMFGQHTAYAGRLKDIPHDVAHEASAGVETIRNVGQRAEGDTRVTGLLKDFGRIVGGGVQTAFSPITGAVRSMAGRPFAERADVTFRQGEPTSREEFYQRSIFERMRAATPKAKIEFHEPQPTTEENLDKITGALTFVVPGVGLVRYGQLGQRLRNTEVSRAIERIFSPTTVSDDARAAEEMLRGAGGQAARDTETARHVLSTHQRVLNALPEPQRLAFIDHIEGGPAQIMRLPQPLQRVALDMRNAFAERRAHLQQLPSTAGADFIEDYFPHMWQDPNQARAAFTGGGGVSRQGSGASMRARSVPTIADGIAQGLVPVTTDPIELSMRYITSMDRFIASERAREVAQQAGYAHWVRPRVVGASGHPQSMNAPQGWVPLAGRGSERLDGSRLYAPEDFARVYNNFISRGIEGDWGSVYNAALRSSNFVTAWELSLSGYHALAMTHEAAVSQMASAIQNVVGGVRRGDVMQVLRGAGQAATHPAAAFSRYRTGRELERVYLGMSPGSPDMARMVGLLERAGGRAVGSRHAQIQAAASSNYWEAFRRGSLRAMHAADMADIRAHPVLGSARTFFRTMGRAMDTMSHPLFNVYIPRLKNGAFYETMRTWLTNHPNATYPEQVRAARMVWDSVDNRFGEMVQDNIFWSTTMKRVAQLGMRSYSWNMGTIREIGGGVLDTARGQGVVDSTRAAYIVALPMVVGTMNAIYQYLKTGQAPQSVDDLVAARTGGEVPGPAVPSMKPFGRSQRQMIPERVMLPGYQKDVFGWYENWQNEMLNKIATMPRTLVQLAMNNDWRGLPIVNPEDSAPEWLKQYFKFAEESYGPITLRQKDKPGSKITTGERMFGLKEAPAYITAPEDYANQQKGLNLQRWRLKQNIDKRQQQLYGGPDEE